MDTNGKEMIESTKEPTSQSEIKVQPDTDDSSHSHTSDDPLTDASSSDEALPIVEFEELFQKAVKVKVIDRIGNPDIKPLEKLDKQSVTEEMERLLGILADNDIVLQFSFNYDDITKYRFITEELLGMTFQHLDFDGMKYCFRYEDYHPNHKGNIEYLSEQFLKLLLSDKWEPVVPEYMMALTISVNGRTVSRNEFARLADTFRTNLSSAEPAEFHHKQISFDSEELTGSAEGYMNVVARNDSDIEVELVRKFRFEFRYLDNCWKISAVSIEGLEFDKID